jgi:hypothetical protein
MTVAAGVCAYFALSFAATGTGAVFNRGDKLLGLCLLAAAGGFAELTSRLAS